MAIKLGINGFGRIGKMVFRQALKRDDIEVAAINDLMTIEQLAYLIKYDSVHGKLNAEVVVKGETIEIDGKPIKVYSSPHPLMIPWRKAMVDMVMESTGEFTHRKELEQHIAAGAPKVILSAPPGDEVDKQIVLGINDGILSPCDTIISNTSCTTNCLLPMLKVIDENFGIESTYMTTIHPYTNGQRVIDMPHKDYRRGRTAGVNLIPTTTGAIVAAGAIYPHLADKLDGHSVRVPVSDGSLIDLIAVTGAELNVGDINSKFHEASLEMPRILEYCTDPIVSSDVIGNAHSCVFDSLSTKVIGRNMMRVTGWYDNEFGYSNRMLDLVAKFYSIK